MQKQIVIAIACLLPFVAAAQDQASKQAIEKWRQCADATATRYAKSTESAPVVARLAALACVSEKKEAARAVSQNDGASFAEEYVDTAEKYYLDRLAVKVIEIRLKDAEKR